MTTRGGVTVTGLARTVLDLAATEPNRDVALRALDAARRRPHHLPWRELWACLALHARRGRPGVKVFRELLEHRDGTEPTGDVFEALVYDLLVDAGLPAPELQYPVGRYRLDLAPGFPVHPQPAISLRPRHGLLMRIRDREKVRAAA